MFDSPLDASSAYDRTWTSTVARVSEVRYAAMSIKHRIWVGVTASATQVTSCTLGSSARTRTTLTKLASVPKPVPDTMISLPPYREPAGGDTPVT